MEVPNLLKEKIRRQSPLLYFAVPFALGIAVSELLQGLVWLKLVFFILTLFFATLTLSFYIFEKAEISKFIFCIFAFCSGVFIFAYKYPPNPYPDWATRDVNLKLYIERADTNAKGASYGFAKVIEAPEHFKKCENSRLWFYAKDSENVFRGDTLSGIFTVRAVENKEDFDAYLKTQKINFKLTKSGNFENEKGKFPHTLYKKVRDYISKKLSVYKNEQDAQSAGARAFKAMVLGDKSMLSKDAKSDFSATGTMHIFAISGLHVGLIAGVIYLLLALCRLPVNLRPIICLPILFLYVNACGARPSAMRAFMMIAFVWLAVSLFRKPKPLAGFILAFCVSLLMRPSDLFDAGFALSYGVVIAILLYAVPLYDEIRNHFQRGFIFNTKLTQLKLKIRDYILIAFLISFAALFASAPLSSAYFGYIAPLSIPFSIVYVACASVVLSLGVFAMFLPSFIVQYSNELAAFIMQFMLDGAALGAKTSLVINLKISGIWAFIIESLLILTLFLFYKIKGKKKWILFPLLSCTGILLAAIF